MVLLRLNFQTEKADKRLWVGPAEMFLKFIKSWSQVSRPKMKRVVSDREGPILRMAAARKHEKERNIREEAARAQEKKEGEAREKETPEPQEAVSDIVDGSEAEKKE